MHSSVGSIRQFPGGIEIEILAEGLLVRQSGEAYVARSWELSQSTVELINSAIDAGLGCMIRDDHPRRNARWPNPRGVVYLGFSPSPTLQWSVALDSYKAAKSDFGVAVFNGKYLAQFESAHIPFRFEGRNKSSGHLVVSREYVIPTVQQLSNFDHSVLSLNRRIIEGEGFGTEYVLQRQLITDWDRTPWSARYDFEQDEFPVDGGYTSRRIDILAKNRLTGDWLIIELKRAEASVDAIQQVCDYRLALGRRDDFAFGRIDAVLVAERIPQAVRNAAKDEGIAAFEASWPMTLRRVA